MVDIKTVYNNAHKYFKGEAWDDTMPKALEKYKNARPNDEEADAIFEIVQAFTFGCVSPKEPKDRETLNEYIEKYQKDADFRKLMDKSLNHLRDQYKNQDFALPNGDVVNFADYINETKKQLQDGKLDYRARLENLSKTF